MTRQRKPGFMDPPGYPDNPRITEDWLRYVYAYFQNCYSPDGTDRNATHAIIIRPVTCACGEWFHTPGGMADHLARHTHPVTAFGVLVRTTPGHGEVTIPVPPAAHHLGYLFVCTFFPAHEPRLDLIADPLTPMITGDDN